MVKTIDAKVLIKGIMYNVSGLLTLVYWILDSLNTTGVYHIGTKLRNNCRKRNFLKTTFRTAKVLFLTDEPSKCILVLS